MTKPLSEKQLAVLRKHQFVRGQSGNPGGLGSAKRLLTAALKERLARQYQDGPETWAEAIARTMCQRAVNGDVAASKTLLSDLCAGKGWNHKRL